MKPKILLILSSIAFIFFILLLLEVCIRFLFPDINPQGTQLSLFQERSFGNTAGWKPNAIGVSFGKMINIDSDGFRKLTSPTEYTDSWILLGDSVAFGVGVNSEKAFAQLLQNNYNSIKVWNTSVVGYKIQNYKDVLYWFLNNRRHITKVIVFFCLNDLYGDLDLRREQNIRRRLKLFLQMKSKLYMFLKNLLYDRSKMHALFDIGLYKPDRIELLNCFDIISDMKAALDETEIDLIFVLLPYEFQIRTKKKIHLIPQKLLTSFLEKENIETIDTYDRFIQDGKESQKYFLYGDSMHLSALGHQIVCNAVSDYLTNAYRNGSLPE